MPKLTNNRRLAGNTFLLAFLSALLLSAIPERKALIYPLHLSFLFASFVAVTAIRQACLYRQTKNRSVRAFYYSMMHKLIRAFCTSRRQTHKLFPQCTQYCTLWGGSMLPELTYGILAQPCTLHQGRASCIKPLQSKLAELKACRHHRFFMQPNSLPLGSLSPSTTSPLCSPDSTSPFRRAAKLPLR